MSSLPPVSREELSTAALAGEPPIERARVRAGRTYSCAAARTGSLKCSL